MKKFFYVFFALFMTTLVGCGNVVDEGMIAVKKNVFTGKYQDGYTESGWYLSPMHTFMEIDAREVIIPVSTDPKDVDGVALPMVKVEMRVRINNYDGIIPALRNNLRIEAGNSLGTSRLASDAQVAVRQVSETLKAEKMFSDNADFAKLLTTQYQLILDTTYPKLFKVTQANVLKVDVPDFIQNKISSVAARTAEIERNNASISSIESRKNLQKKEAELIKDYMIHAGINADQYVEMEKIKMVREIYEDANSNDNQSDGKNGSLPTMIINLSK